MAADSSAFLEAGAATLGGTDGTRESGSARTVRALDVELPTTGAHTTTCWLRLADTYAARPRSVQAFGALVALVLLAAGALLDMKAAQKDTLEIVMTAVRQDGLALKWAGDDLKDNKAVVLAAVQQIGDAVEFASERLKGDREVALRAARHSSLGTVLKSLQDSLLKDDPEVQLEAVRHAPNELRFAPLVQNNKAAVLDVVRHKAWCLGYAADSLKLDRDVVLEAVRQSGDALKSVYHSDPTSKLLKDQEVVLEAVRTGARSLEWVSKAVNANDVDLTKDREVVLAAVRQEGFALMWAHEDMQKDLAVVTAAVLNRGCALQFAKGKAQEEAGFAAIFRDSGALTWASKEITGDSKIVSDAAGIWQSGWDCNQLKKEIDIVMGFAQDGKWKDSEREKLQRKMNLAVMKYDGTCLEKLPHLKADRPVVDAAVRRNGLALKYVDPKLQQDRELVLAAVRQNGIALEYAAPELKDDKDVVLAAVQQSGLALQHAKSFSDNREVVLVAVRQNGKALEHADAALKSDKDVVLAAVRHDMPISLKKSNSQLAGYSHCQALRYADEKLQRDRDVVLEALRSNGRALEWVKVAEMTATWTRTIIAGVIVLVLCIKVVVPLVFTPHEASSGTAGSNELL